MTFRVFAVLFMTLIAAMGQVCFAADAGIQTLTPEQMENYQFPVTSTPDRTVVKELTIGQREILDTMRREMKDIFARRLGILSIKGTKEDLGAMQALVDRKVLRKDQVREWQSLGVLFADILVREQGLTWVNYEDDLGVAKALRWRNSDNYVFPVTLFSKRVYFDEEINMAQIYAELTAQIAEFKTNEVRDSLLKRKQ